MPALPQFTYIFALGIVFAFADAFNIGANDVANAFSTSVSSRSLTLRQAALIATFCEFLGALLLGARVADTIRQRIIDVNRFEGDPAALMLGMLCALIGSSTWLTICTRIGLPTSSTHSIVGSVIGVGIATLGTGGVTWGWNGVAQILASWVIAPFISGACAALIFLITKYVVLKRKNSLMAGMRMMPVYFAFTTGILTMMVVWKGAPALSLDNLSAGTIIAAIFGVIGVTVLITLLLFYPFLYRRLVMEDWTLRWYHLFLGPFLWKRGPVPHCPEEQRIVVQNYYRGHLTKEELEARDASLRLYREATELGERMSAHISPKSLPVYPPVSKPPSSSAGSRSSASSPSSLTSIPQRLSPDENNKTSNTTSQNSHGPVVNYCKTVIWPTIRKVVLHGVDQDIVQLQQRDSRHVRTKRLERMHSRAAHYDNQTEHLFSFLQVLTASTQSFAHGSNDVANAVGPLATIYLVWQTNTIAATVPVPVWVLAFGGLAIVIGFATWGYSVMKNLGNRLTLHSPSRGFSMELGSALTVLLASRLGLPISTAQCIVGATLAVGLCNGNWKAMNWRMALWIFGGWILTVPIAATLAGCVMAFIINAPQWNR